MDEKPDWKNHGVRIVRSGELDTNTPQTRGMTRAEAISLARVGAQKLWAGTVTVHPRAKTGPHHHGELETITVEGFSVLPLVAGLPSGEKSINSLGYKLWTLY